jgi:hypothetical protein
MIFSNHTRHICGTIQFSRFVNSCLNPLINRFSLSHIDDLSENFPEAMPASETSPIENLAPRDQSSFAQERPIPDAPPVIAITFPLKVGPDGVVILNRQRNSLSEM